MTQEEGDYCQTCNGRGGTVETQDPVGDGGGWESFLDACPNCIGAGKCPSCMGPLGEPARDDPYICARGCGWQSESIGVYDDEPSWGDYGDD